MAHISNFDRNQTLFFCFDNYIPIDSPVRLVDAFVDKLNLNSLGFLTFDSSAPGQKPYSRHSLLKLIIFGYMSGMRSSRKLASACSDSISFIWLTSGASPSKSSIADFVKVNELPIQNTFKLFVKFLKNADFIDGNVVAIDGTKIRAQNSRNKYYSIKKIDNTIEHFNSQIKHFTSLLKNADSDAPSSSEQTIAIKQKIDGYQKKIDDFLALKNNMLEQRAFSAYSH